MLNKQLFEQSEVKAFTKEEQERIFTEARRKYSTGKPVYQYGEVLVCLFHLGVRIGEMIGALKSDINWEKREMRIQCGAQRVKVRDEEGRATGHQEMVVTTTKSQRGKRILTINEKAMVSLRRLCEANPNSDLLVYTQNGGMTNATRVERCFSSILKKCWDRTCWFAFSASLMCDAAVQKQYTYKRCGGYIGTRKSQFFIGYVC